MSYFIFKCNGVKCTIVSTESTSKWYECGAWVNPSSYFLPLFNNSAIGQWGGGIVPLGACGERVAAFIWPENEEEEMGGSGRNLESCLQISLRTRKASSEHLWTESPRSPSLFLLDLPVLFFYKGYLFRANIWSTPKECGSMRTLRGSQRHLWSWRGGMYRFFVKLTFLIPAIVISQGKVSQKKRFVAWDHRLQPTIQIRLWRS